MRTSGAVLATVVLVAALAIPVPSRAQTAPAPPPTLAPGADLEGWLAHQPEVAAALRWQEVDGTILPFHSWPAAMRARLAQLLTGIGRGEPPGLPEAPPLLKPSDPASPFPPLNPELARWSPELARETYLAYVAQSLAVQLAGWVPWSIEHDSGEALALLFDSRSLWRADPATRSYRIPYDFGAITPGDPYRQFQFLRANGLIGSTSRQTIERVIDWTGRNVTHFQGDWDAANMFATWQYYGWPPVERIIAGTVNTAQPGLKARHVAGACFGTVGFLRLVLRTVNIPVELLHPCPGHGVPHFVREDLYLSHGDDPYDTMLIGSPPIPAAALLIDRTQYEAWLGGDEVSITQCKNIGRQVRELAIEWLPDELLRRRCTDRAANTDPARGQVYDTFKFYYSVSQLEGRALWKRLDEKIAALGGCGQLPPAEVSPR